MPIRQKNAPSSREMQSRNTWVDHMGCCGVWRPAGWGHTKPQPEPGACGDPECHVLHNDPANPIHPPFYVDSREETP